MSNTLASLGLPEPKPVAAPADTLAALGLPEPAPAEGRFLNPFKGPRAGDEFSPERIAGRDLPIVPEYPIEGAVATFGLPGIGNPALKGMELARRAFPAGANWLLRSAAGGAAAGATGGLIAESGKGPVEAAKGAATGAVAGGLLSPPLEAAAPAVGRLFSRKPTAPAAAPTSPVEPVETLPVAGNAPEPGPSSVGRPVAPAAPAVEPTVGPLKVPEQQAPAAHEQVIEAIRKDPAYDALVRRLGGGRVVSNEETLRRAAEAGPMAPDEIAGWQAGRALNEVEQTRALLTENYYQAKWAQAIAANDEPATLEAASALAKMRAGLENVRATGGRMTQAQAMFVRDEMTRMLGELADMRAKGVPQEQVTARANELIRQAKVKAKAAGLNAEVRAAVSGLETFATAMKLTSPVTHAINTISNATNFAITRPIEKAGTAATLAAQGDLAGARAETSAIFGTTMGWRSGLERYLKTLMDDAPDLGAIAGETLKDRNIPLPKVLRPLDPFRQLSAADAFWKGILEDAKLYELAHKSATQQGLTGTARAARINELRASPPADWIKQAEKLAQEYTFQDDADKFLKSVQGIANLPGMRFVLPFTKTPYNLLKFGFQRSPQGILSPRNLTGLKAGGQEQAEAVGRLTAGIALSAGALALVNTTEATGPYPSDAKERERWQRDNIQEYSLKLPDGTWLKYSRFSPLGQYIGQAVVLRDAMRAGDSKAVERIAPNILAFNLRMIADQPFMSGVSNLVDAVKGAGEPDGRNKSAPEKLGEGIVTGMLPSVLRDVRQQTDDTLRVARGVGPAVQNMIPGLSQRLPASIDELGRPRTYEPNRLTRATKVLSTRRATPESELLDEVGRKAKQADPLKDLKGREKQQYEQEIGEAKRDAVKKLDTPAFRALPSEKQQKRMDDAIRDSRSKVRDRWKKKMFGRNLLGAGR